MARITGIDARLIIAGGVLAVGMLGMMLAADSGVVDLGAGDMKIVLAKGERGITMDIAPRTCPPHCGIDLSWRPLAR